MQATAEVPLSQSGVPSVIRWRVLLGDEVKVLLVVAVGLLLGELGIRLVEDQLSKDVHHLQSFERLACELESAQPHPHVLFLGNSMTRYGISRETFEQEFFSLTGTRPATIKFNPDNTALAEWYYAYENYFFDAGRHPDVVVIGFEGGHLRDQPSHHVARLAQYYCDADDWKALCQNDLKTFEDRAAYVLSSVSCMYGNRDRLQRRVLDALIPAYRDGSQALNIRQSALADKKRSAPTYSRLQEFLDMVRAQDVHVILAAMPVRAPYDLDPGLLDLVRREGIQLIDCRQIPGIVPEMFPDGIHMTAQAAELYSRYLADHMVGDRLAGGQTAPIRSSHSRSNSSSHTAL